LVERDIYLSRKAALLDDKATLVSRKTAIEGGDVIAHLGADRSVTGWAARRPEMERWRWLGLVDSS
jgi:nucleoside-diphosphate-sugar epimerase